MTDTTSPALRTWAPTTTMAPMFCSARPASSSRTVASGLIVTTAAPLFRKTSAIRIKAFSRL